jgi:hypothetical protein
MAFAIGTTLILLLAVGAALLVRWAITRLMQDPSARDSERGHSAHSEFAGPSGR